jgi:hypothetical protein
MRFACVMLLAFVIAPASAATVAPSKSSGTESLGNQLLNDLAPSIPPKTPTVSPGPTQSDTKQDAQRLPVAPRFDDLGEDIGQPSGPLPLVRARQGMQQATALLGESTKVVDRRPLQQAGSVQQQVVAQLDQLIAELSKQCQGGQCPPSDQPAQASQRSQPKPGQSASSKGQGKTAARDSTDRLDGKNAAAVDQRDINDVVKQLWGHLPERSREQMLQSFSEEFLPKYELEIEQYYRRLSEDPQEIRPSLKSAR